MALLLPLAFASFAFGGVIVALFLVARIAARSLAVTRRLSITVRSFLGLVAAGRIFNNLCLSTGPGLATLSFLLAILVISITSRQRFLRGSVHTRLNSLKPCAQCGVHTLELLELSRQVRSIRFVLRTFHTQRA